MRFILFVIFGLVVVWMYKIGKRKNRIMCTPNSVAHNIDNQKKKPLKTQWIALKMFFVVVVRFHLILMEANKNWLQSRQNRK